MVDLQPTLFEDLPLFSDLPRDDLDRISTAVTLYNCSAGQVIFKEGEYPGSLHFILSGRVELMSSVSRRGCGIVVMTAGDVFMPAAVILNERYVNSARAVFASRLLLIDAQSARAEVSRGSVFALRLIQTLAEQYRLMMRQTVELKCQTAAQRLADLLLRMAAEEDGTPVKLPIPKRNLAFRLGITPETLSRTLQILAANGLHVRGNRIIVKDLERICKFCGFERSPRRSQHVRAL